MNGPGGSFVRIFKNRGFYDFRKIENVNRGFFENSNNRTTLISTCPKRGDQKFRTHSLTKPPCHPTIGQMRVSDEVSKTGGHLIEDLDEGRRRRRHHHGTRSLPAETSAFCHCVLLLLLLLLPLHQPAQNRRTVGDAHLDQCMNGARIFIIGSCYQSLSSSYAYLFNSPPLIIRSGVLMNE